MKEEKEVVIPDLPIEKIKPKIEKIRDGLYVKKSFDGYRVVYPYKNDDGTINWKNLLLGGNWWNLLKTIFILLFIFGFTWSYLHDIRVCKELSDRIIKNPCEFCVVPEIGREIIPKLNMTKIYESVLIENGT